MKHVLKKTVAFTLVLMLVVALVPQNTAEALEPICVGMLWDGVNAGTGSFTVSENSRVFVAVDSEPEGELLQTVQLLQRELSALFGGKCFTELVWGEESLAATGDVILKLDTTLAAEGFALNVTESAAVVTAKDTDGLIYGTNNLMKCFRAAGDGEASRTISCLSGSDAPDTAERTVMLDCGRKYYTAAWIKNFIKQISWMGYNTLELHFSEDGGFRADFWDEAYYTDGFRPVNDFSWLAGSYVQDWVHGAYENDPDQGRYLTTAELVEICETAKEYHIDIIPSFDSPAHMDYITWKFEQNSDQNPGYSFTYGGETYSPKDQNGCINYTGRINATYTAWPYYAAINIKDEMARAFVFSLYEDIADFFKVYAGSTDFSIGADEVNLASGYDFKWDYTDFPGYINKLNGILNAKGYTVRMFNDFIGSGKYSLNQFDSNIEIMYWDSPFDPNSGYTDKKLPAANFVADGRTLYNCIQTSTYYVLRVANTSNEYNGMDARNPDNYNWVFYHSTEDRIFNEWRPNNVSEIGLYRENTADIPAANLGGAYFLIWSDYASLNTEEEIWKGVQDGDYFYALFDRMASNVLKMWNSDIDTDAIKAGAFNVLQKTFGFFPGYVSCSEAAVLPAAAQLQKAEKPGGDDSGSTPTDPTDPSPEPGTGEKILVIEKLTKTARKGKQVGLRIITAADVDSITVAGQTLTVCSGKVQTLQNLGQVKVWVIGFPADKVGQFTYTISADGTETASVSVTIR